MNIMYSTGGRGNVYIGRGFAHSRRATINVSSATFNTDVLAIQNGAEVMYGKMEAPYYDIITPNGNKYFTKFTAKGNLNAEIGEIVIVGNDGSFGRHYSQATAPVVGSFSYSTATREITFASGDEPLPGEKISCYYKFKSDSAQKIKVNSGGVPPLVLVTAFGLVADVCTGEYFNFSLEGTAQMDGNWNFDLAADGEPATQNLTLEFVKSCTNSDLYEMMVYTEDEADDDVVATPVANPVGGSYSAEQAVTLTCATAGATIYYTVDGNDPTTASTKYTTTITIPASATTALKAIAYKDGMTNSAILAESYVIS